MSWVFLAGGVLAFSAAFLVPVEYTIDGGRTLEGWWLAMIGICMIASGFAWKTSWRSAALLTGLLILGFTAQLTLTQPHWAMSLRVASNQLQRPEQLLSFAFLAFQVLLCLALTWSWRRSIIRFSKSAASPGRILGGGVVFFFCASNVAAFYPEVFELGYKTELYGRSFIVAAVILGVNLTLLWRIALAMPVPNLERLRSRVRECFSLPGYQDTPKPWDRTLVWGTAGFVLLVTLFFGLGVLQGTAQFGDEVVYQFMAKVFAQGAVAVPAPPVPEAFEMYLVEERDGLRYGLFIPGWPLILAIGMIFGAPWLVNPVLAALSILATHALTRRLVDRGTANIAILLLATSPWFLILSSVYQPHAATLLAALVSWLSIHRASSHRAHLWALGAGLAAGVAFCVRPMDGMLIGGASGLYAAFALRGGRAWWTILTVYVAGCVATGAISLGFNYVYTGELLTYPMNVYLDREWGIGANRLGFGPEVGQLWDVLDPIPGHGWRDVLYNLNLNAFTLNYELFGWGIGSLFLVAVQMLWGRLTRLDWMCIAYIVAALSMYSLYWFNGGPDYGPRYWYTLIFPLVLLSTSGIQTLVSMFEAQKPRFAAGARIGLLVGLLSCSGVVVFGSWRAVAKYVDYRSKTFLVRDLLDAGSFGENGLVVVDAQGQEEYAALELNDPVPGENGTVFARDLGSETTAALIDAFPGRPAYRLTLRITIDGKVAVVEPIQQVSVP